MEETENNMDTAKEVSPKNNFWVWIVVALATTVSTIALWGDNQKDKLITKYAEDKEDCEKAIYRRDSLLNNKTIEIDTLRNALYISQSNSIDKYIEYDAKFKRINNIIDKDNEELQRLNKVRKENIDNLTKLRREIKK